MSISSIDWTKPIRLVGTDIVVSNVSPRYYVTLPDSTVKYVRPEALENAPEPRFVWFNVYRRNISDEQLGLPGVGRGFVSREDADQAASGSLDHRSHVLKVNVDTGETEKQAA